MLRRLARNSWEVFWTAVLLLGCFLAVLAIKVAQTHKPTDETP